MKKPYLMRIDETYTKQVIVWAEDRETAIKKTEDLCANAVIDMTLEGRRNLEVFCQFKAYPHDFDIFQQYNKEDVE